MVIVYKSSCFSRYWTLMHDQWRIQWELRPVELCPFDIDALFFGSCRAVVPKPVQAIITQIKTPTMSYLPSIFRSDRS